VAEDASPAQQSEDGVLADEGRSVEASVEAPVQSAAEPDLDEALRDSVGYEPERKLQAATGQGRRYGLAALILLVAGVIIAGLWWHGTRAGARTPGTPGSAASGEASAAEAPAAPPP
jgi:hypothetical protein